MVTRSATDVSVVVCTYTFDRWNDLLEGVASARAQTIPPGEIIVVVDHNLELLWHIQAQLPGVVAVPNSNVRGLSGGRNTGVSVGQGKFIAFLDDDATATPTWLEQSLDALRDERVLGVGGSVAARWHSARPGWFPEEFNWVVGCSYRGLPTTPAPVRNLFGGTMCVRRDIFQRAGGFRDDLGRVNRRPVGGEDTEWCIRALEQFPGCYFFFNPAIVVHHNVPANRATLEYFVSRCYHEGCSKAILTHHTRRQVNGRLGLASERSYALQTLPRGVLAGLCDAGHGGVPRAAAIMTGLMAAGFGYMAERTRQLRILGTT
jgi:GT2 family glycosyltransferase